MRKRKKQNLPLVRDYEGWGMQSILYEYTQKVRKATLKKFLKTYINKQIDKSVDELAQRILDRVDFVDMYQNIEKKVTSTAHVKYIK